MMTSGGSPTSNLFPSISSLFQSPIGTPRVTPTPHHLAAYFLNDDHFHSLLFNPPASSGGGGGGGCGDLSNMISNFADSHSNLSPLPLFNNLISTSMLGGYGGYHASQARDGKCLV